MAISSLQRPPPLAQPSGYRGGPLITWFAHCSVCLVWVDYDDYDQPSDEAAPSKMPGAEHHWYVSTAQEYVYIYIYM